MSTSLQASFPQLPLAQIGDSEREQVLAQAFASFSSAAASLERGYLQLQAEASRLRRELEVKNCDLAASLEENRRTRQHLNHILEGLPCGVLVRESDGTVSLVNPEARRLLGAVSDAAIDGLHPLPVWVGELLADAASEGQEHEYLCRQCEVEAIAVRRSQLSEADGASAIFILQDRTASKRLEREREALRRRRALAEMATLLAHEIRNPLGSLELFAGLLAASGLPAELQGWVGQMQAGLRLLSATANNVLHFHSPPQLHLASLDLGPWLRSFAEFVEPLARQAQVEIKLETELDGAIIAADRHRLEQVMLNLALNAFRAMPGGGVIMISGRNDFSHRQRPIRIEIADNGPGIASRDLTRIFDPGFSSSRGTGLGLSVAKAIVEQHQGVISAESRAGQGTRFTLAFPTAKGAR